ncbi:hypothetical protein FACS189485_05560 [Spirochaetia bacterium]|nr:hypothetical protein FACS189485_05560 [Spirochaetia bacterium]
MKNFAKLLIVFSFAFLCCSQTGIVNGSVEPNTRGLVVEPGSEDAGVEVFPHLDGAIYSVAYSSDGSRIVSCGSDGEIRIWDAASGRNIRTLYGHIGSAESAAFSPDGRYIVSGGQDTTIRIWDAESGSELRTLRGHNEIVVCVRYSPDGKYIVSGSVDTTIRIWDAESGQELYSLKGHTKTVISVAYSPDGKHIVSGSYDKTIKIWDAGNGREFRTLAGHDARVTSVAYSPDGRHIASGSYDRTIKVWDAESGQEVHTAVMTHPDFRVITVTYSPDGRRIVSGSTDRTLKVWDAESGQELYSLEGHTNTVFGAAYSPDGRRIVSVSGDTTLKVWDAESGRELLAITGYTDSKNIAIYSSDGKRIVSGSENNSIIVWDAEEGRLLQPLVGHTDRVYSIAYSPGGKYIASGGADRTIKIWDAGSGQLLRTFSNPGTVFCVAYSPDGKYIAAGTGGGDRGIRIWDAESGQMFLTLKGHGANVVSIVYSADGRRIISGSLDNTIKIWDVESAVILRTLTGHTYYVVEIALSPDEKYIVSGSSDKTVKIWDAQSGQLLRTLSQPHVVRSIAFSPDGRFIAACVDDMTIRIWDTENGNEVRTIRKLKGTVFSARYSADGKRILSGGKDGTVRIWDAETGKEIAQYVNFTGKDANITAGSRGLTVETTNQVASVNEEWICITPDGYFNASPRGDRYLYVRIGNEVTGIDAYRSAFYRPEVVQARLNGRPDPESRTGITIQQAASFRPPTVTIQSPVSGSSVTTTTANLSVVIADQNQPIQNIKILVNGRLIGRDELSSITGTAGLTAEKASLSLTGNQKNVSFELPVNLDPGQNIIEVVAFNGYAESRKTVELNWQTRTGQQITLPNLWILAVGVNQYDNAGPRLKGLTNLNYCVNDAREIISSFKKQEGKRYGKVNTLLIADDSAVNPTAQNIRDNLQFLAGAGPRDVILFFLAGHGISDRTGRFFFLPRDAAFTADGSLDPARVITADDIVSVLDEPGNRLVFIDACQSGGVDSSRLIRSLMNSNAFVFSASQGNEASEELPEFKHGVFSYSIIRELQGAGAAKSAGSVGMLQLSGYVSSEVIRITQHRQHPKSYYQGYHDFPIAEIR